MLIDWFTVTAQVINFLILVWLMKRFLYQPILAAIDAREKQIAKTLADAANVQQQAQQARDEFEQHNAEFKQQRETKLSELHTELQLERQRLLNEAQQAATTLQTKRQAELASELQRLSQQLREHTQQEVLAIIRKALQDLADTQLDEHIVTVFLQHISEMDAETQTRFKTAFNSAPAQLHSAHPLTEAQQAQIQQQLQQLFATDIPLQFEIDAELISGIALICNGQKLAWSMADYLDTLEQRMAELGKVK